MVGFIHALTPHSLLEGFLGGRLAEGCCVVSRAWAQGPTVEVGGCRVAGAWKIKDEVGS